MWNVTSGKKSVLCANVHNNVPIPEGIVQDTLVYWIGVTKIANSVRKCMRNKTRNMECGIMSKL